MVDLFPSITPDNEPFVDDEYSRSELAQKDYDELRKIAANHPTEECNGRDERERIVDVLTGKERIEL